MAIQGLSPMMGDRFPFPIAVSLELEVTATGTYLSEFRIT